MSFSSGQFLNDDTNDFREYEQAKCRRVRFFEHQSFVKQKFLFIDDFFTNECAGFCNGKFH